MVIFAEKNHLASGPQMSVHFLVAMRNKQINGWWQEVWPEVARGLLTPWSVWFLVYVNLDPVSAGGDAAALGPAERDGDDAVDVGEEDRDADAHRHGSYHRRNDQLEDERKVCGFEHPTLT